MKKAPIVVAALFAVFAFAGARAASAQEPLVAHVPFPFVVAGKVLPAGDYRAQTRDGQMDVLQIESVDGRLSVFTTMENTGATAPEKPDFQFKKIGDEYLLWRVNLPGLALYEVPTPKLPAEAKYAKTATEHDKAVGTEK